MAIKSSLRQGDILQFPSHALKTMTTDNNNQVHMTNIPFPDEDNWFPTRERVDRETAIASIQKYLNDIGFPEGDLSIKDGKLFVGNEPATKTN